MADAVSIKIDFRPFINRMRYYNEQIERSVTSEGVKEEIFQNLANEYLYSKGKDSGATNASLDAVYSGRYVMDEQYVSPKNGAKRYANGSIGPKGIYLDPVDEYDYHYGTKSILGWDELTDYNNVKSEAYEIIYQHILDVIGG